MARMFDVPEDVVNTYSDWAKSKPENVRAVVERFDPWSLYTLKETGQKVTISSFCDHEDGSVTLTVYVPEEFNEPWRLSGFLVFGVNPASLKPCDAPPVARPLKHDRFRLTSTAINMLAKIKS